MTRQTFCGTSIVTAQSAPPTADEVLEIVRAALAAPAIERSALHARLEHARELQRQFRAEPVGGKLVTLKKLVYWFAASSFDRQAKTVEALLDAVEELVDEVERAGTAPAGRGKDR